MKSLRITIVAYDYCELVMLIKNDEDFEKAKKIIEDCNNDWESDDELAENYDDISCYFEEKLDEAKIDYEYLSFDDELTLLDNAM